MGHVNGARINPYNVQFTNTKTVAEYSTPNFRFELRLGHGNWSWWLWLRVTVIKGSNYLMSDGVELRTPYGTARGLPYGDGGELDCWLAALQRGDRCWIRSLACQGDLQEFRLWRFPFQDGQCDQALRQAFACAKA